MTSYRRECLQKEKKMSETYIVTAKTVEEAMAEANRKYSTPGKDVSFAILEMPKKGFLGFGAKEAKVQVTVTDEETISLDSLVVERKGNQQKRNGGRENARTERPEPTERTERRQRPMTQNPNRGMQERGGKAPKEEREQREVRQNPVPQEGVAANVPAKNPNRAPQQERKPEQKKPAVKDTPKTEPHSKPENPQAAAPKPENPPRSERKPAGKPEMKPEEKSTPNVEPKTAPHVEAKSAPKVEPKTAPQAAPKAEAKGEQKGAPKAEAEQKSAFKSGEKGGKPTHTSVVREVNIISDVPLEAPDTTETKRYTPKTVEQKRDAQQKTVVREVNILSAIPEADPNASPFRAVPGWDKKEERGAEAIEKVEKCAENEPVPVEACADGGMQAMDSVDGADAVTKFSRHTDDEALSMEELLVALPENVREPERRKVGVTEAEMQAAVDFVNTLLRDMQLSATCMPVACPEGEEYERAGDANLYPAVEINGDGSGILIGHHGETLDAIQCLLNLASVRKSDHASGAENVKISLDIENYRTKREEALRSLARRMAARAVKYKRNVFLEPMNAYERRIIHSELQGVALVSTHSVGTDKNRKIIITYEGADKKPMAERNGAQKKRHPNPQAEQGQHTGGEENAERPRRNRKPGGAGEKKDRPRPPKPQKLPFESVPEFLENASAEPAEQLREP